jgi:CBS domain containing-hemolysin-like protein
MDPWISTLLAVPVLIGTSAFLVSAEYTLVALRPAQLDALRQSHPRVARAMASLKANPASAIGTIQVCITICNLLLGWLGEPAMSQLLVDAAGPLSHYVSEPVFKGLSIAGSFFIVTLLTVVFSELLPKTLTLRYLVLTAQLTAVPIFALDRGLRPLVWLMNSIANIVTRPLGLGRVDRVDVERVSVEELRVLTADATRDGVLTTRERSLILNAMSLGKRSARQIMVPRVKVAYLDLRWDMQKNRDVMDTRLFSRLPLCDGGMDNVVGIVHTKEFLTAYHASGDSSVLQLIARAPVFVPEQTPTDRLLWLVHEKHTQIVLLVDEYGGVSGIVTLRDIVDELVGAVDHSLSLTAQGLTGDLTELQDRPLRLTLPGDTAVHELRQRLGNTEWCKDEQAATIAGLMQDQAHRMLSPGECVEIDGIRLTVLESDSRRIAKVEVIRTA